MTLHQICSNKSRAYTNPRTHFSGAQATASLNLHGVDASHIGTTSQEDSGSWALDDSTLPDMPRREKVFSQLRVFEYCTSVLNA